MKIRADQIEILKIRHGYGDAVFNKFNDKIVTKENSKVLIQNHCRLDVRKCAFSHRIVSLWNKLSASCVNGTSVNMSKNLIDNYFQRAGYT